MGELPHDGPTSYLLSRQLYEELADWGVEGWEFLRDTLATAALNYPDGSLEILFEELTPAQVKVFERFRAGLLQACWDKRSAEKRGLGLEGFQTCFRALWGSPRRLYHLFYADSVQQSLGDQSLLVVPDAWCEVHRNEGERNRLEVAVLTMGKPDRIYRQKLARVMFDWLTTVSTSGVQGEGPVVPVQQPIEWRGRAMFLRLDFSRSGQATLNSLIFWLSNRTQGCPIEFMSFGNPDAHLLAPSLKSAPIFEDLALMNDVPICMDERSAREQVPITDRRISICRHASFDPQRATLEIEFADPPDEEESRNVEDVLISWLRLGLHGGYKGHFTYHSAPEWRSDHNALSVLLDFGTADVEESLTILARISQSLSNEVRRIEKVVCA